MNTFHSLLYACCILYLAIPCIAQLPLYEPVCDTAFNYTPISPYATNLNLTLHSLAANASLQGFYSTISGQDPDQVFGQLTCRGDISPQQCQKCAQDSTSEILQSCHYQKKASIYYNHCWLRYAQYRFFSTRNNDGEFCLRNKNDVVDPGRFFQMVNSLIYNLSSSAASNSLKFSGGMTSFTDTINIYGMAQCSRDISNNSCLDCLKRMIGYISSCASGKQGGRIFSESCYVRFEDYAFLGLSTPAPPPRTVIAGSTPRLSVQQQEERGVTILLKLVIASVGSTMFTATICICMFWRRIKRIIMGEGSNENVKTVVFDLSTLKTATKNFSDSYKLGQGGFGAVYKGELPDGSKVAVKKLSHTSKQGLEELKTEVVLVAKLLHINLVRLLGFCLEEEKLLVYEYLPNGSLDQILFDDNKRVLLDWDIRYKIIVGIARGLLYLHHDSQIRIIHRDLKASNILLDEVMNPKISDFGLARLFCNSQTQVNTNQIAGTYGYIAPEYAKNGHFSTKSDVFSFGVLLLEIVTGKKNSSFRGSGNLVSLVWRHWNYGTALEMVDDTLEDRWLKSEAIKCIHIGLLCVQNDAGDRPSMSEVILMLSSYTFACPVPSQPAFYVNVSSTETPDVIHGSNSSSNAQQSANWMTISEMEPR